MELSITLFVHGHVCVGAFNGIDRSFSGAPECSTVAEFECECI